MHGDLDVRKVAGLWGSSPNNLSLDSGGDFKTYFGDLEYVFARDMFGKGNANGDGNGSSNGQS